MPVEGARVTLWIDYGPEGWKPREFETTGFLLAAIKGGETHGQKFRITEEVDLALLMPPKYAPPFFISPDEEDVA